MMDIKKKRPGSKAIQVRGVDPAIWKLAVADARDCGIYLGKWLGSVINLYLHREKWAKEYCRGKGWREPR